MRNRVLSIFHTVIPYVKELRAMAGSMEGCILMQQLDYWFALKPDGFYKFLEPVQPKGKDGQGNPIPGHRLYSPGDSWCEELNCSPHEFRRMFDAIGVRWNSKSEFMNASDPFCGRGYCSYVDRKENLTHYFRNHALVDAFLDQFVVDGAKILRSSEKRSTDLRGLNLQSPKKSASIKHILLADITSSSGKVRGGMQSRTQSRTQSQITVWQSGDVHGSIEEFITANFWMQKKSGGFKSGPIAFKRSVRERIRTAGPDAEDWETLKLWRESQIKMPPPKALEEEKNASENRQRLADAKKRYAAMEMSQQREIESSFAAHLQEANSFVFQTYCKSGLDSGIVSGAFYDWLVQQF